LAIGGYQLYNKSQPKSGCPLSQHDRKLMIEMEGSQENQKVPKINGDVQGIPRQIKRKAVMNI